MKATETIQGEVREPGLVTSIRVRVRVRVSELGVGDLSLLWEDGEKSLDLLRLLLEVGFVHRAR